jgi:hypothetical protein
MKSFALMDIDNDIATGHTIETVLEKSIPSDTGTIAVTQSVAAHSADIVDVDVRGDSQIQGGAATSSALHTLTWIQYNPPTVDMVNRPMRGSGLAHGNTSITATSSVTRSVVFEILC